MQLEATGERVIEEFYLASPQKYLIYLFHIATYRFALAHVQDKRVLDYGCGSGYGTHFVAPSCAAIAGVDISADAIDYAASRYQAPNLAYRRIERAEAAPLPFADASYDVVLSFQVIEHIEDVNPYLREIWRVLKPGGILICATPDRSTRLLPRQKPWNVWHVREYGADDFKRTLSTVFNGVDLWKMGGTPEILNLELRRTRLMRWLTLPFTLPFVPESLRVAALHLMKKSRRGVPVASPLGKIISVLARKILSSRQRSVPVLI